MKQGSTIKLYFATLGVFLLIDTIWLVVVAQGFYQEQIGYLLSDKPNILAAGLFYALYVVGLLLFVVIPALKHKQNIKHTALMGGLFGFFAYATYDLTNYATIKDWPLIITVVDMVWGFVLSASVSALSFLIARKYL